MSETNLSVATLPFDPNGYGDILSVREFLRERWSRRPEQSSLIEIRINPETLRTFYAGLLSGIRHFLDPTPVGKLYLAALQDIALMTFRHERSRRMGGYFDVYSLEAFPIWADITIAEGQVALIEIGQ